MAHVDYATSKKNVVKGLVILAVITLIEVGFSLVFPNMFGKLMILGLSIFKAYYIMYKFMHLGEEATVLKWGIVLPFILLAWGMIAFLQEGNAWRERRVQIEDPVKTEMFNHLDDKVHDTHDTHSQNDHDAEKHDDHH